ncbi:Triosephosphate isomerase [Thalictrum thalictroides]|uniref:Triosephosphate isomerase n=1 Tax=Thalictrum thalictroides TaxID=46969 RepID=A0A7J6WVE3_THATH|nr:Triosephosphate isomerase [Thalictrum thalictroides]
MEITTQSDIHVPQAMDTTEGVASDPVHSMLNRKIKKGVPMKRSKNVRKMKAIEKAISKFEKSEEKSKKLGNKRQRTQSAKLLYD